MSQGVGVCGGVGLVWCWVCGWVKVGTRVRYVGEGVVCAVVCDTDTSNCINEAVKFLIPIDSAPST